MRKHYMLWVSSLLLLGCKNTIAVSDYPPPTFVDTKPQKTHTPIKISVIETGYAKTLEAFVFKGGSYFKTKKLCHNAIVIQHPKATFLLDTGLGSNTQKQVKEHFSFLDRKTFAFTQTTTVKQKLQEEGVALKSIDFIIPTHLHFDHVGGLEDFPGTPIWVTKAEYDFAKSTKAHTPAFIKQQYDANTLQWHFFDFDNTPYACFSKSYDVFKDQSVILVPLPGHTNGSIGVFVNKSATERYFFIGDLSWSKQGILQPAVKHAIPRKKVDLHPDIVTQTLVKVHHLAKKYPNLHIIAAHDFLAQKALDRF